MSWGLSERKNRQHPASCLVCSKCSMNGILHPPPLTRQIKCTKKLLLVYPDDPLARTELQFRGWLLGLNPVMKMFLLFQNVDRGGGADYNSFVSHVLWFFESFCVTQEVSLVAVLARCGRELCDNWPQATEKAWRVRNCVAGLIFFRGAVGNYWRYPKCHPWSVSPLA